MTTCPRVKSFLGVLCRTGFFLRHFALSEKSACVVLMNSASPTKARVLNLSMEPRFHQPSIRSLHHDSYFELPRHRGRPGAYSHLRGWLTPQGLFLATRHANRTRPSALPRVPTSTSTTTAPPACGRSPPLQSSGSSSSPTAPTAVASRRRSAPPRGPLPSAGRATPHCPAC